MANCLPSKRYGHHGWYFCGERIFQKNTIFFCGNVRCGGQTARIVLTRGDRDGSSKVLRCENGDNREAGDV